MRAHPVLAAAVDDRRRRLLASARGRVLDVGGFQDNVRHYPPGVTVHDIEPLDLAELSETGFDTVVCTLALCGFDDIGQALARIGDVMAPDARLLFLEHVRGGGGRGLAQRISRPLWSQVFSGCRPDRDTVAAVRDAGFFISDLERFSFRAAAPLISPGVSGQARRK